MTVETALPPPPTHDRLTQRDFRRLAEVIHGYSGIKMPPTKITMVEGRLRRRLHATGLGSLADYCGYLFDQDGLDHEIVHLIDAVTTNKTEFFREPEHFRLLADTAVPALLKGRAPGEHGPLKVWSAACSTGAEPYTIAMVLAEAARHHPALRAAIFATDLCTEVLRTAAAGIYPQSMMAPIPPNCRRYVMAGKRERHGLVRIVPELRSQIRFGRLNLMDSSYPLDSDMDVIFCRNILIYFDKPTQRQVLERLCAHLRPGGYLILGHSESLTGMQLPVRTLRNTVFQRPTA